VSIPEARFESAGPLAFLTFSGIVTALSTFFLSDDLRLLLTAPVATRRLFYARFARTVAQSGVHHR